MPELLLSGHSVTTVIMRVSTTRVQDQVTQRHELRTITTSRTTSSSVSRLAAM